MNFQDLKHVESAKFYLELAFRKAKEAASRAREQKATSSNQRSKNIELGKINTFKENLEANLMKIIKSYPSIDGLPEFYQELVKASIDYAQLKKSLGAVNWASRMINEVYRKQSPKIKYAAKVKEMNEARNEFYGRASSIMKQIDPQLKYLEQSRKIMKEFPSIKTKMYTISIAGFPNVGKTTLLSKLTGSKPEIANYAFTTKQINAGYIETEYSKIQVLDTPGTLNRFNLMNNVEKQAYLAVKYCADTIVYVFDPTESSYPMKQQEDLLKLLGKFDKEIIIYLSKTDIVDKELVGEFRKKFKIITDSDVLKNILIMKDKEWNRL